MNIGKKRIVLYTTFLFYGILFYVYRYPILEKLLIYIEGEDTHFAKCYTEEGWKKIEEGDGIKDVKKILGEPLSTYYSSNGNLVFIYSEHGAFDYHYLERYIVFNPKTKKVKEKIGLFYYD